MRQSTYKCGNCGKLTRETGRGESQFMLCANCMEGEEYSNAHYDGVHDDKYEPKCPICRAERGTRTAIKIVHSSSSKKKSKKPVIKRRK